MRKNLLSKFGNSSQRIKNAIKSLQLGHGIMLLDDENRENEGDLVFPSETMTIEQMALTIRYGSGIVCLCITERMRQQLELPMMVEKNTSAYGTGFTVTIESKYGISTGVSAKDRLTTITTAVSDCAKPNDLNRPGHVFPVKAHVEGVLARPGHTEASILLMELAGFKSSSVICELTNKDGSMANTHQVIQFAKYKKMNVLTIKDLINYIK
ncbi:3,4-dihydroxy-2-butanone 4-phosphate synthase [Buchnera aphidicola (Nipponaphis monzeni)]|uniref:3,4-dihydroxy-2-butanone 4-phosphate synthase n=1 Tax=Buchnera aphidicola (Nipponaphis monzeni) TaxID=2495405 RepID=A0A455T9U1_9GAMM|nr:3,4-dihydroxy-2-butanone-4-phosphate synthase [Buchnera aphidicola]BBI01065.1 3,4-dihydroxy-2-butanone 4-phosphate synthase [Buchnera aphidicola (Nipponaphis monzeni)]